VVPSEVIITTTSAESAAAAAEAAAAEAAGESAATATAARLITGWSLGAWAKEAEDQWAEAQRVKDGRLHSVAGPWHTLPATSSTRILNLWFLSQTAYYDHSAVYARRRHAFSTPAYCAKWHTTQIGWGGQTGMWTFLELLDGRPYKFTVRATSEIGRSI